MTLGVGVLAVLGVALMVIAGLGIVRMPDLPTRMHASSKAGTLGAALVLVSVALHFSEAAITVRVLLVCAFMLLTAPIASHVIARAAYRIGVPLSPETVIDELGRATTTSAEERPIRPQTPSPPRDLPGGPSS